MKQSHVYTLSELADRVGAELRGDPAKRVMGLNSLQDASDSELSFLANPAYARYLQDSDAGAVILAPGQADGYQGNVLLLDNPYLGYAALSHLFETDRGQIQGIHSSATVHSSSAIHETAAIGSNVVVEAGVQIAEGVRVDSGAVIGHDTIIGRDSHICRNATLCHSVVLGERVIIHANAVIGADGFGNAHSEGRWHKIAQLGGVIIGNDVEIGSCTCIDRGALGNTVIGDGARLDNLIQIAHNVVIGRNTAIAANVGISGSTRIGDNCTIAGAAGFAGHITVADNVHIGGMAMVTRSIKESGAYASGTGLMEARDWRKNAIRFRQLDDLARRVKSLEKGQ
ncbi:MAG: UDP-3-O-(3-hydroxymyristoyl)glucosamine N-acyltransferase [Endozoicomonas sp.]